ncbi:MAG: precorrin-6y C5,15-methyltransferase (decarboxylating) subunit CbiE [Desulfamplus sp.]|nr:precorrin-6y C5,15-methyltransferase (decarboxylating) subunit CbiE [Desulfamplus sp.]
MRVVEVIGFGLSPDDLTEKHKRIIADADVLVAGRRHLELLQGIENRKKVPEQKHNYDQDHADAQGVPRENIAITKDIQSVVDIIKDRIGQGRQVVVVASGDPLFHGIGTTLINALGKESVNIYPNISSMAAAFAAIKETWDSADLISLHGKDCDIEFDRLNDLLFKDERMFSRTRMFSNTRLIAILTDHIKTPAWLAEYLASKKQDDKSFNLSMYVFENLGADNQKISFYEHIEDAADEKFSNPNVVIIKKITTDKHKQIEVGKVEVENIEELVERTVEHGQKSESKRYYPLKIYQGMADDLFFHEKGLITKSEIRAVVLSKLQLTSDDHIFWDLGAGSGSVSIEVSKFIPKGKIFAVERNESRILDIKKNMEQFGLSATDSVAGQGSLITDSRARAGQDGLIIDNIAGQGSLMTVIHGEILYAMQNLPEPDRIFIGGGGKDIEEIIKRAGERLKTDGVMVINTVLIQTMNMAMDILKTMSFHVKLIQVQVSVSKEMPFGERLDALNPVWIISGKKLG